MDKMAVLIPCYNESKTIEKVVNDYRKALPEAVIYVYDNNSTDGTDEIARKAGAIVRYERKQGKGNVIRSMFRQIEADCYLMIDGDDTYPVENAQEMCEFVLKLNTYKDGARVIKTIATLFKEYKPGLFFNLISLLLFIITCVLAIPVFSEYFKTGLVPRFPTLIVSGILLVCSLLLSTTGIILQVIAKKNKQLFEIMLNQIEIMKQANTGSEKDDREKYSNR